MNHESLQDIPKVPTIFVIFGITGDLSKSKLIPALLDLFSKKALPSKFAVVGFSRRDISKQDFDQFLREVVDKRKHNHGPELVNEFIKAFSYHQGFFDDHDYYEKLKGHLGEIDDSFGQCSNKLFYLAVPPTQYETILMQIDKTGLSKPCDDNTGWTRILIEKPFGNDLKTAEKLDMLLGKLFKEKQIFRIDHYLAKEALQNIMVFRFANGLFEPIWNNKYISQVNIKFHEKEGVGSRGSFYDSVGALRDVGQNHMLQMLALVGMEEPEKLEETFIRKERAKVIGDLKKITGSDLIKNTIRAQYEGYGDESGVETGSQVETYFKIYTEIRNRRWKGVPFVLEFGKALAEEKMEIAVHMSAGKKENLDKYNCKNETCRCNILTFRIQPNEGINITFWVKKPGFKSEVESKKLNFTYDSGGEPQALPDAYERVLYDCILGDQSLFTSTEEVKNAWRFITPIIENWQKTKLYTYRKGSAGPRINNEN